MIASAARANNRSVSPPARQHPQAPKAQDVEQVSISGEQASDAPVSVPRKYFVLTSAGKPVYAYNPLPPGQKEEEEDVDQLVTSAVGVMQAIISIFADEGDKLRYMDAGHVRISFLLRSPLYLVAVSQWGEPQSVVRPSAQFVSLLLANSLHSVPASHALGVSALAHPVHHHPCPASPALCSALQF